MSKTVFILGAGASKQAGVPLMTEFLDVAHDLWKLGRFADADADFKSVFNGISALQAIYSKSRLDLNNLEAVFSAFEMANTLRVFPHHTQEQIQNMIDSFKRLIGHTIEETLKLPMRDRGYVAGPEPYGHFVDLIQYLREEAAPKHAVSVITFNYDLSCDYSFYEKRIWVDYGLGENNGSSTMPLLKLHGSLNWAYCPDLKRVVPWTMQEHFAKYHWDGWRSSGTVKFAMMSHLKNFKYENHDVSPEPYLVPPTWSKTEYQRNISVVWNRAAKELSLAENIFIIGYSLPESDAFFRYLYALGTVGDDLLKRIWVFNPDKSEDVQNRYVQLLGPAAEARYRYIAEPFSTAIAIIKNTFSSKHQ